MSETDQQGQTVHNQINVGGNATIGQIGDNYGLTVAEVRQLMVELQREQQQTVWNGRNPYRGLEAYAESDARYFFGRESLVATVVERVQTANFVTISGPSGSGKSSLARAGVFHALRQGAIDGSDQWLLAHMQPKGNPLEQLALAIEHLTQTPDSGDYLRQNGRKKADALHKQAETLLGSDDKRRFVLLIDQFEELFTQTKDAAMRRAFIALLTEAVQAENGRCKIILSLRSDFVSHCASYDTLRALISQQFQLVGAMSPRDLAKAITLPALEVGAKIDPELVSRIITDMKGSPDALPLMNFALRDLFAAEETTVGKPMNLTLTEYTARGGLDDALEQHANIVFANFSKQQKQIAEAIFSKLIEVGQGRADTRRTAMLAELIPANGDEAAIREVVQILSAKNVRLLTTNGTEEETILETADSQQTTVTIAHEKLIDAWPWLRQLVNKNRELIALQIQIESNAKAWHRQMDNSYLYRGGRLLQIEERESVLRPLLSSTAHDFIAASIAERQWLEAEAEAIRQQEEELKSQKRVGRILRGATAVVGVLLVIALILAYQASQGQALARKAEATATIAAGEAIIQAENALDAQATATVAQGQAEIDRDIALVAQATATVAQGQAELAAIEVENFARVNQIPSLAASTWSVLVQESHDELSVLLGIEASRLNNELHAPFSNQVYAGLKNALAQPYFANQLIYYTTDDQNSTSITALAYSPDGRWLAVAMDGKIGLWDITNQTDKPTVLTGHPERVSSLAFSPNGQQLASAGDGTGGDFSVRLWDLASLTADPIILNVSGLVESVAYSPDGDQLAFSSTDGTVRLLSLANLDLAPIILEGHSDSTLFVTFRPDGQQLASSSEDGTVRLWDLIDSETDSIILEGHTDWVYSVAYSPDGRQLASASLDGTVRLWDLTNPADNPAILEGHTDSVYSVAYSPDGQQLASASADGTVRLWDLTDQVSTILNGNMDSVSLVAYSPDGQQLASASYADVVRLWDLTLPAAAPITLSVGTDGMLSVNYSPDGRQLASGDANNKVFLWDLMDLDAPPRIMIGHTSWVRSIVYSPVGQQLASASYDGTVRIWDLTNFNNVSSNILEGHLDGVFSVAYSPDGQQLVSADYEGALLIHNLIDSSSIQIENTDAINSVAYNPSGRQLATASNDGIVRLWDPRNMGTSPILLRGHAGFVLSVAYNPDGQSLASAGGDGTVRLWNPVDSTADIAVLQGHTDLVYSVAYSPDGQELASAGQDGSVRLWDLSNPNAIPIILEEHSDSIWSVAYAPDGMRLASASWDGTVMIRPTLPGLVEIGCGTVWRNLSWEEWQQHLPLEPLYQLTCPNLPAHQSVATVVSQMEEADREAQIAHITEQAPEWGERMRQDVEAILAAQE